MKDLNYSSVINKKSGVNSGDWKFGGLSESQNRQFLFIKCSEGLSLATGMFSRLLFVEFWDRFR